MAVAASSNLIAATNGFVAPTFRGTANSQSGYWETFAIPVGAPGNLPDQPGATTTAVLTQTDPNAFLTGSGNIYNFTDADVFIVSNTTPFTLGTVVLQTRTQGSEINSDSVNLTYTDSNNVSQAVAPLFSYELDRTSLGAQGSAVSTLRQWDLTGLGVTNYNLHFAAASSSMSFDSMTLDTAAQFAPAFVGQPFAVKSRATSIARWMYPFNGNPAGRPAASVFAAFGSAGSFDTRDAQFLLGWDTTNIIPAGMGARNYLIRQARVALTISSGNQYVYTGILRDYRSYFPTNDPRHVAPASSGAPVELYGVGFRGGWTVATFLQDTTFFASGGGDFTNRTAYAAGFDTNGVLADVSNNVGDDGTNEIGGAFEVAPFAVGQTADVSEGQLMPVGSQLTFDVNIDDPLIYGYLQNALNDGKLDLMVSSLLAASFTGAPNYPNFYTIFNSLADPSQYPLLDIEGAVVRTNLDTDADGLADDWENFYFGKLGVGATNSFAGDGISNLAKYIAGTDPTNPANDFRLLSIQNQSGGKELRFNFAPNRQYAIQSSADLKNWLATTNPSLNYSSAWLQKSGTNATYPTPVYATWHDTNTASVQKFYRASVQ